MGLVSELLDAPGIARPTDETEARKLAARLSEGQGLTIVPQSIVGNEGAICAMGRKKGERMLLVAERAGGRTADAFEGKSGVTEFDREKLQTLVCETDHANAATIRDVLLSLRPQPIGLRKSFGFGDRLGLATPGHVRAARTSAMRPVFAQQSIREMTRSGRTPENVLDDATWGMLEAGWTQGAGADADHLKNTDDIDVCLGAGFTMFTIDPNEHVDDAAGTDAVAALIRKYDALPWCEMETSREDCRKAYLSGRITIGGALTIAFTEETLLRAACKYGRAVLHVAKMYRHLASKAPADGVELEVSVDETETPTSVAEHYYVASELKRLGVEWVSLAPRFVGRFEKGVDYIGDLAEFERTFAGHVEIARHLGPYKLSLHSGSDKFSIYPIAAEHAGELIHVKTAGTSYLEALRVAARIDPALFREVLDFARGRYEEDKKTYHVSADLAKVPAASSLEDDELADVVEQFDAREVLHVTYGSVLMTKDKSGKPLFRERLLSLLKHNPDAYAAALEKHLGKHVRPFA
ncbi:MAG TPA: tagaturonate epimerase family protein [Planctomycetota bacterium]|nr:tagaturonate epimerase family protein [Planctomycetota bacterium]